VKVGIMQPYFLPYIGYFQLIQAVDVFVLYDNIKYTKKGWINRNRYLANGQEKAFSLPLKKDSDSLDIRDRVLASDFNPKKTLNGISEAYRKAPYYQSGMAILQEIFSHEDRNLFSFTHHAVVKTCQHLGIDTSIVISSQVPADHTLAGEQRVIAICQKLGADSYINPPGGRALYSADNFKEKNIQLKFIDPALCPYPQLTNQFVAGLSIIDVIMNNDQQMLTELLSHYSISDN
jgi:hypothetical protein